MNILMNIKPKSLKKKQKKPAW